MYSLLVHKYSNIYKFDTGNIHDGLLYTAVIILWLTASAAECLPLLTLLVYDFIDAHAIVWYFHLMYLKTNTPHASSSHTSGSPEHSHVRRSRLAETEIEILDREGTSNHRNSLKWSRASAWRSNPREMGQPDIECDQVLGPSSGEGSSRRCRQAFTLDACPPSIPLHHLPRPRVSR